MKLNYVKEATVNNNRLDYLNATEKDIKEMINTVTKNVNTCLTLLKQDAQAGVQADVLTENELDGIYSGLMAIIEQYDL